MKRFFKALLRITVGLAALLVLFHLVENWRGKRAWARWKASREALGESFEWASVIPPPVPDDQNFAKAPVVAASVGADFDSTKTMLQGIAVPKDPGSRRTWRKGEREDLQAWVLASGAKDLDSMLQPMEGRLRELEAASRRPGCRLPVDYAKLEIPTLFGFRSAAKVFRLRALRRLQAADGNGALEDVQTLFRIAGHLEKEPQLISSLTRRAILELALQPIWEGLECHTWNEVQLVVLGQAVSGPDELASFRRVLQGERIFASMSLAKLAEAPVLERAQALAVWEGFNTGEVKSSSMAPVKWALMPKGWVFQNMVQRDRARAADIRECLDPGNHRVFPAATEIAQRRDATLRGPYAALASQGVLIPTWGLDRVARTQAALDLARVAVALERHRLAKGAYPPSLEDLKPGFLAAIPVDVCDGQPLRYRLEAHGRFTLYSVGWNGRDDGGNIALKAVEPKQIDFDAGDWTWPTIQVGKAR